VIRQLILTNFKGFERFTVPFGPESWLVGPNNAGKSTIIAALRTSARMVNLAKRRRPEFFAMDGARQVAGHAFSAGQFGLIEENLRHEFRDVETRFEVRFANGAQLRAVWPPAAEELEPYFYAQNPDSVVIRTTAAARQHLPDVGVIPILSPLEHQENRLSDEYVRANASGRLASRHARNQLRMLRDQEPSVEGYDNKLAEFLDWARPWTRDFRVGDLVERTTDDGVVLDVFCREVGAHSERELFWAGDGVQVWIQLLAHLFRNQARDALILDEPDLYLHADLQRRLVRILESLDVQTIAASHSAEVLVESPPESVVWISRDRRRAVRSPSEKVASELSASIGSHFNLRLARALRANAVLFVEGDDMRMLRNLGTTTGATRVAAELGIVTIPLRGFSNWQHVEPFAWLLEELLERSVQTMVVLDRDYRVDEQVADVEQRLRDVGVTPHVWKRKELENYLLVPTAIARRSGASVADVTATLDRAAADRKEQVFARVLAERLPLEVPRGRAVTTITEDSRSDFDRSWASVERRPHLCNAKELLSDLNRFLQSHGHRTVSARTLSSGLRRDEIDDEVAEVLYRADELAGGQAG
jgi:hypothetical protein